MTEKELIKQCGGFCQMCLAYPSADNKLSVIFIDGDKTNTRGRNQYVMCDTCRAKRDGRPSPGIPKGKIIQSTLFG
jgi:hypothetical protein